MENAVTKQQILSELTKSPHGNYSEYIPIGQRAATEDPEFLGRLIAWNRDNGEIRDSKVAMPVVSLSVPQFDNPELVENSIAHLALLDPRNLVKALRFQKEIKTPGHGHAINRMVERYLRYRESDWDRRFMPTAVRFRSSLKELYSLYRVQRSEKVGAILFKGERGGPKVKAPKGSVIEGIERLKDMQVNEVAAFIAGKRIPFLTAKAALGDRVKEPDILRVLVERMSPTELTTNAKWLEKLGMKTMPAVRGAFQEALAKASVSTKNVLKTTKAVESVEDESLKENLRGLQERQISQIKTIEGDWAVLGDMSGSMKTCIEAARHVAGTLAKLVKGKVYLIFFNVTPRFLDVSGKTYEEISKLTSMIKATGGTSIGCGLQALIDRNLTVDGIAIVSDAQENVVPHFAERYVEYKRRTGSEPTVYLYRYGPYVPRGLYATDTDLRDSMKARGIEMPEFDLNGKTDYYAIPNLAKTMTVGKYSLIDQVYATPLITLDMVFGGQFEKSKRKENKLQHA